MLAKQSSSGLADVLLRELVSDSKTTAEEAKLMAEKYEVE